MADWAAFKYCYISEDIRQIQESIEVQELTRMETWDRTALSLLEESGEIACSLYLTGQCGENAGSVVDQWWDFAWKSVVKYDDGYINTPGHMGHEVGYPQWWLDQSGWSNGPISYTP
jgi:hypothetical protein